MLVPSTGAKAGLCMIDAGGDMANLSLRDSSAYREENRNKLLKEQGTKSDQLAGKHLDHLVQNYDKSCCREK